MAGGDLTPAEKRKKARFRSNVAGPGGTASVARGRTDRQGGWIDLADRGGAGYSPEIRQVAETARAAMARWTHLLPGGGRWNEVLSLPPAALEVNLERDNSILEGMEAANRLLGMERAPTAVFGATGLPVSLGIMTAVREKGLNVPRDISVAGFGDFDIPTICDPQLTTIKSPVNEMGKLAMKVLLEMIEKGDRDARQYCLETELVIRGSCTGPDNSRFYIDP